MPGMSGRSRHGAGVISCLTGLLAAAALAGCGSTAAAGKAASGRAAAGKAAASPAGRASPAPSPPAPSLPAASHVPAAPAELDARALSAALLPAGAMPKGYALNRQSSGFNGGALPADTRSPVPASQLCHVLFQTVWIRAGGINTKDWAVTDYFSADRTAEINEEIDAFQGTDAQAAMTGLWNAFGRCGHFTISDGGGRPLHVTMTRGKLSSQWPAIKNVQTSPQIGGGSTEVAIRVGDAIVTVLDSSGGSDKGSAAISMAERIAARISAAEAGR